MEIERNSSYPSRLKFRDAVNKTIIGKMQKVVLETTEGIEPIMGFDQMGLKDDLLRGIYNYGLEKPSAIQQRAVMPIINGLDVIAQAQSGTGKTSMIALAVCQVVDTTTREYVFSLIIVLYELKLVDSC